MNSLPNYKYICDTNIWVKVNLCDKLAVFLSKFKELAFAEVVENEISKWRDNNIKYSKIYETFINHKNQSIIQVIVHSELPLCIQNIVFNDLQTYFGITEMDNSERSISNLGECISVLYAYHLEIPYFQSDDIAFFEENNIQERFRDLKLVTWNDIARCITKDERERIRLNALIEVEEENMKRDRQECLEKKKLEEKLFQLKERYSNRNNK